MIMLVSTVLVSAVGCDSGGGPTGVASIEPSVDRVDLGVPQDRTKPLDFTIEFTNIGGARGRIDHFVLTVIDSTCGTFKLGTDDSAANIEAGQTFEIPVSFRPKSSDLNGCDCSAYALLDVELDCEPYSMQIPLVVLGQCDQDILCSPRIVTFPGARVDETASQSVTCVNYSDISHEVTAVRLKNKINGLTLKSVEPEAPFQIGSMEYVKIGLGLSPDDQIDYNDILEVYYSSGEDYLKATTEIAARPVYRYPPCSGTFGQDPAPLLITPEWTIELEKDVPTDFDGVVRARRYYEGEDPLISDVFVASGVIASTDCSVSQSGHRATIECSRQWGPDDLAANIHVVPFDSEIEGLIREIKVWDELLIRGWEVAKIQYANGSSFVDAGCFTTIVTRVCDTRF